MPSSRRFPRYLRLSRRYHLPPPKPNRPAQVVSGLMLLIMVAVTIWSAHDGGRSPELTVTASIGVVAAVKVLTILTAMLPATRWASALTSALWVVAFMPAWDWLANRFVYPDTLWTAVVFGSGYGLVRMAFMPGRSARPPF